MSHAPASIQPAPSPGDLFSKPPDRRRQPVVVDANALIEDAVYRTDHEWSALSALARSDQVTLLAPAQIDAEVYKHLPRVAGMTGRNSTLAVSMWEEHYRPFIRFVDVSAGLLADAGAAAVAEADVDDAPVMALARFVGPALVVTRDKHITRAGTGESDWLTGLHLLGGLTELDAKLWGGAQAAWLTVSLPAVGLHELGKLLARNPWALGAMLGAGLFLVTEVRPDLRRGVGTLGQRIAPTFLRAIEAADATLQQRAAQTRALERYLVEPPEERGLTAHAARLLAQAGRPLPLVNVHHEMSYGYGDVSLNAVRTAMNCEPAFRAIRGRGYDLGSLGSPAWR